jgi:hypothetical protein
MPEFEQETEGGKQLVRTQPRHQTFFNMPVDCYRAPGQPKWNTVVLSLEDHQRATATAFRYPGNRMAATKKHQDRHPTTRDNQKLLLY